MIKPQNESRYKQALHRRREADAAAKVATFEFNRIAREMALDELQSAGFEIGEVVNSDLFRNGIMRVVINGSHYDAESNSIKAVVAPVEANFGGGYVVSLDRLVKIKTEGTTK